MVKDQETFNVWYNLVKDVPFEVAHQNVIRHLQTSPFFPKPVNIIGDYLTRQPSYYELQRAEEQADALALEEYNQQAVPMPDHIRKRLEKLQSSRRLNHES